MNSFCVTCRHREVPKILKESFDEHVKPFFGEDCPMDNEKFIYCFTKNYKINWFGIINTLIVENKLSAEKIEEIKNLGNEDGRK